MQTVCLAQSSTRQVNYAGNHGFPPGTGCNVPANCPAPDMTPNATDGAVQYFDAAQVAAGNCAGIVTASPQNAVCATSIIEAGDTITWVFENDGIVAQHSATSGTCGATCTSDGKFDTKVQQSFGATYNFTFPTSNVYPYFCLIHGSAMKGTVIVQDYTVAISNPTLVAYKSQNAAFTGILDGLPAASNPFNYPVNLNCLNPTAGLNCTPNPSSASPSAAGTSVTVNTSAPAAGDYTFQLQGNGLDPDGLTRNSGTATLHVMDLSLTGGLSNVTLGPSGSSASFAIGSVTSSAVFPGNLNLSCSGLPAGSSCAFTPSASVAPSGSAQALKAAVTTSGTPGGNYTVTITADPGNGLTPKTTTFQLVVQDFSFSVTAPTTVSVPTNTNATFNGTISSQNSYAGTVVVSCAGGNPPGTCTGQNVVLAAGQANAPFTVTAKSASNGQFNFNVQGAGPLSATHATPVTVNVGDFSMGTPSANTLTAAAGNPSNSTTFTLVTSQIGFSVPVVLTCNGLPAGATCTFFPSANILATGTSQTVTMYVEAGTAVAGTYGITIHGVGNGISHDAGNASPNITLKVVAGGASADMQITSFTHSPEPVMVGSTVTFTAVVKNNGPNATSGVTLTFNADNGAAIMNASANAGGYVCTTGAPPITCSGGATALNSGVGVTFTVKAQAPFTRFMTAGAQVSSAAADPTPANNTPAGQNANIRLRPLTHNNIPAKLP